MKLRSLLIVGFAVCIALLPSCDATESAETAASTKASNSARGTGLARRPKHSKTGLAAGLEGLWPGFQLTIRISHRTAALAQRPPQELAYTEPGPCRRGRNAATRESSIAGRLAGIPSRGPEVLSGSTASRGLSRRPSSEARIDSCPTRKT